MEELAKKLIQVQHELKAPKGQFNKFGNYAYRSAEDILEAVKPLLNKAGLLLTVSDEIVSVGERVYVKANATITNGKDAYTVTAFAREEPAKKGMDGSQITGSSSSYARKYALNGLFLIDDTKDADATNRHEKETLKDQIKKITTTEELRQLWNSTTEEDQEKYKADFDKKKSEFVLKFAKATNDGGNS